MSLKPFNSFIFLCLFLIPQFTFSQQVKKLRVDGSPTLDFARYEGESMWGFGAHLKLLWTPGNNKNAFGFGIDFDRLSHKSLYNGETSTYTFTVASIGYRIRMNSFYVEPQAGGGFYKELYRETDYNAGCFFLGLEPGIEKKRFSFSINYRFISADGLVFGEQFNMFSAKIGYMLVGTR